MAPAMAVSRTSCVRSSETGLGCGDKLIPFREASIISRLRTYGAHPTYSVNEGLTAYSLNPATMSELGSSLKKRSAPKNVNPTSPLLTAELTTAGTSNLGLVLETVNALTAAPRNAFSKMSDLQTPYEQ